MSFICIRIKKSFSYQWRRTEPRFETEARGNWEMAYYYKAGSASGKDAAHPASWLATRLARSGFPALVPQQEKVLF